MEENQSYRNFENELANSVAITYEINRFEGVHPNIYRCYELLQRVDDPTVRESIQNCLLSIEGSILELAFFDTKMLLLHFFFVCRVIRE